MRASLKGYSALQRNAIGNLRYQPFRGGDRLPNRPDKIRDPVPILGATRPCRRAKTDALSMMKPFGTTCHGLGMVVSAIDALAPLLLRRKAYFWNQGSGVAGEKVFKRVAAERVADVGLRSAAVPQGGAWDTERSGRPSAASGASKGHGAKLLEPIYVGTASAWSPWFAPNPAFEVNVTHVRKARREIHQIVRRRHPPTAGAASCQAGATMAHRSHAMTPVITSKAMLARWRPQIMRIGIIRRSRNDSLRDSSILSMRY